MSLGLLGDYGSDSGSEVASDSPRRTGEEDQSVNNSPKPHVPTPKPTDVNPQDLACLSEAGRMEKEEEEEEEEEVVVDKRRQKAGSPPLTSFGLSGEGDILDTDTSDSLPSEEEEEEEEGGVKISRERSPLPLPVLDGSDRLPSSVFSNPYQEAEAAKLAVLTQHVGLSHNVEPSKRERRRRSRGRAKGRRRDGHSQFRSEPAGDGGDCYWNEGDSPIGGPGGRGGGGGGQGQRKHRSGVTDSLQPPKKFMKIHQKIRSQEQPWTAQ